MFPLLAFTCVHVVVEQHGNGTQEKFEQLPYTFFASSHQGFGFYPCTGYDDEQHEHSNIVNVMLKASCGSKQFRAAYTNKILPALRAFKPDIILISAGFDAHCKLQQSYIFDTLINSSLCFQVNGASDSTLRNVYMQSSYIMHDSHVISICMPYCNAP
jgi:Histone deacetylase domain